jgi:hypothetical protein
MSGVVIIKIKKQLEKDPRKDIAKFAAVLVVAAVIGLLIANNLVYESIPYTEKDTYEIGDVFCTLYTDQTEYTKGQTIDFFIKIGNNGSKPVTLQFAGKHSCEIVIIKETGLKLAYINKEVWRKYNSFNDKTEDNRIILPPYHSRVMSIRWDQKDSREKQVSLGDYLIKTNMKLNDEDIELKTKHRITKK